MSKEELESIVYEVAAIVLATPTVYPDGSKNSSGLLQSKLQEYIAGKLTEQEVQKFLTQNKEPIARKAKQAFHDLVEYGAAVIHVNPNLDGRAMSSQAQMAMLEILNGGPEIGRLTPEERANLLGTVQIKSRQTGRPIFTSTVEDLSKHDGGKLLWMQDGDNFVFDRDKLQQAKESAEKQMGPYEELKGLTQPFPFPTSEDLEKNMDQNCGIPPIKKHAIRYDIVDRNGVTLPRNPLGDGRTYREAVALLENLNRNGEFKPYTMVPIT